MPPHPEDPTRAAIEGLLTRHGRALESAIGTKTKDYEERRRLTGPRRPHPRRGLVERRNAIGGSASGQGRRLQTGCSRSRTRMPPRHRPGDRRQRPSTRRERRGDHSVKITRPERPGVFQANTLVYEKARETHPDRYKDVDVITIEEERPETRSSTRSRSGSIDRNRFFRRLDRCSTYRSRNTKGP